MDRSAGLFRGLFNAADLQSLCDDFREFEVVELEEHWFGGMNGRLVQSMDCIRHESKFTGAGRANQKSPS